MFSWEVKQVDSNYRLVTLDKIEDYRLLSDQLDVYLPPDKFLEQVRSNKKLTGPYKSHNELVTISEMRLWQWKKHFRGKVTSAGNVVEMQFKSKLNLNQEYALDTFLTALYGERYG